MQRLVKIVKDCSNRNFDPMPYEPLHHKYRPQTFGDLVGQEAIATTLTNAIITGRIAPAYLFTGPRGTGKTSSARILAKSLNCLNSKDPTPQPCATCDVCLNIAKGAVLDVIEIDAASNTGVDNIREIIERAQFAPVQCRYKVYIIDEVHMLSLAAFNALLKTLEEPPKNVLFVLATTDPQRVLPTIISRCQRFDFRRIPLESMVKHLGNIAVKENIDITQEALILVGQIAQGGLRDAESLLDQLSLLPGKVTVDAVWDLVGAVPERDLIDLLNALAQDNAVTVLEITRRLMDRGREPLIVLQNLAGFYRDLLIANTASTRPDLVACSESTWIQLCELAQKWEISTILAAQKHLKDSEFQLKNTTQTRLWLEVTLLGLLPSAINTQLTVSTPPVNLVKNPVKQPSAETSYHPPHKSTDIQASITNTLAPDKSIQNSVQETVQTNIEPEVSTAEPVEVTAPARELNQIWQQVIENLQLGARALLKQHCTLLNCDETVAYIQVSTEPLYNMARPKIPKLEAAFLKVLNRKVKVKLEIAGAGESKTADESFERSQKDVGQRGAIAQTTPNLNNPSPQQVQSKPVGDRSDKEDKEDNDDISRPTIYDTIVSPANPVAAVAIPVSETDNGTIENEDLDLDQVAIAQKRISQFFPGKLVKLTDNLEFSDPVPTTAITPDFKHEYQSTIDYEESEIEAEETTEPF